MKNEEKEKGRIRGKSNNNNIIFGFKLYFARKHNLKKRPIVRPLPLIRTFKKLSHPGRGGRLPKILLERGDTPEKGGGLI